MNIYLKRAVFAVLLSAVFLVPAASAYHRGGGGGKCPLMNKSECSKGSCSKHGGKDGCPIVGKTLWMAYEALEHKKELALSDEQIKSIKALKLEVKKQKIRQMAEMQIGMLEMHAKMKEDTLDVEGLKAMIDQGMAAMATNAKASIDQYASLRTILKADQIEKLKELA